MTSFAGDIDRPSLAVQSEESGRSNSLMERTIQFHRWRGVSFDRRPDLFFTWAVNLGWVSVLGYGDVLDVRLRGLLEALRRAEKRRDGE